MIDHETAFPNKFRYFLHGLNIALIATYIVIVVLLAVQDPAKPEDWFKTGKWILSVIVTPTVASTSAYVWLRSRVSSKPEKVINLKFFEIRHTIPIAFTIILVNGVSLLAGIVSLAIYGLNENEGFAGIGVSFALVSAGYLLASLFVVIQAWDTHHKESQRESGNIQAETTPD